MKKLIMLFLVTALVTQMVTAQEFSTKVYLTQLNQSVLLQTESGNYTLDLSSGIKDVTFILQRPNGTIDYTVIQDIVHNNSRLSEIESFVSQKVDQANAAEQSWFTTTFMPNVDVMAQLKSENQALKDEVALKDSVYQQYKNETEEHLTDLQLIQQTLEGENKMYQTMFIIFFISIVIVLGMMIYQRIGKNTSGRW